MAAKLGAVLATMAFGVLMFAAGAIAPESLRKWLGEFGARVMANGGKAAAAPVSAVRASPAPLAASAAAPAASSSASPAPPAAPSPAAPDPVLADTLLIPTPLPDKPLFALQAGQFTSGDLGDALAQRIKSLHLPSTPVIDVVDRAGMRSRVVPVGPYKTLADARMAAPTVARELGLAGPLPLMLLPSPAAAAPAPAATGR